MKVFLRKAYGFMAMAGIDPLRAIGFARGMIFYLKDREKFAQQQKSSNIYFPFGESFPILHERSLSSGTARGHYFHQDLLVAKRIFIHQPVRHVDIGSRVDGFVAHVATFREIVVFDIRPLQNNLGNIIFQQVDMMGEIDASLRNYCDSVSCLHALEHFGLGRYGDPVKFDGYLDGLKNINLLLKDGGKLYISVPIGPQRVEFNAHRVFSLEYLIRLFDGKYRVDNFSYVDDSGDLHQDVSLENNDEVENNFGCKFGCGIFELTKLAAGVTDVLTNKDSGYSHYHRHSRWLD